MLPFYTDLTETKKFAAKTKTLEEFLCQRMCTELCNADLLTTARNWKFLKCPSTGERIDYNVFIEEKVRSQTELEPQPIIQINHVYRVGQKQVYSCFYAK